VSPWLVVLVPAIAALAGLAGGRDDRVARGVALGGSALTLLLAGVGWAVGSPSEVFSLGSALEVGDLRVPLEVLTDPTRWALAAVVALVTLAVQVYSTWYLEADDRYPRFAATVSLFSAAMLLVVVSGDLVLTVVGWEVMGWCSYLLIGHWSRRPSARRAAHKARGRPSWAPSSGPGHDPPSASTPRPPPASPWARRSAPARRPTARCGRCC
jgi:NADH-quinone oxidoreductase subunit L